MTYGKLEKSISDRCASYYVYAMGRDTMENLV